MKSHLLRTSSILAVLTLFVVFSFSSTAQEPRTRQQQPAQQEERQIIDLPVQQLDAELIPNDPMRIAPPKPCHGITPVVQIHDVNDNFAPAGSPVSLSPALTTFLAGKPIKGYDNPQVNKVFADSFRLRNCRVCYATLEVRVRASQDAWTNDTITVGAAPYNSAPGVKFISTGIWTPTTPNPKTLNFALPLTALNAYLSTTPTIPSFLDVVAQDDTDFDYAKLSVWYY